MPPGAFQMPPNASQMLPRCFQIIFGRFQMLADVSQMLPDTSRCLQRALDASHMPEVLPRFFLSYSTCLPDAEDDGLDDHSLMLPLQ